MCNGKGYSTREDGSFALTRSAIPPGEQTQPQGIQFDETFRIALIISACIILARHHLLAIERIRRLPSDYMHSALVKLQPYGAGNLSLAMINRLLKHLTHRRDPDHALDQIP